MLEHGGNLAAASERYGIPLSQWLDLSTGINPAGYPVPDIPPALWQRLPQPPDTLIKAAQAYYAASSLLPVAGSQAAIQALPRLRSSSRVAVLEPMYAEHGHAWRQCGHTVEIWHAVEEDRLQAIDVLLVCNPNNPTGRLISPDELLHWHAQLVRRQGWLVVDEAFMDATPQHSVANYAHMPGLIVLRSLGKFFGLAGARVGFAIAAEPLVDALRELLGPWTLTGPAQWLAEQALRDAAWQETMRSQLIEQQHRLAAVLAAYQLNPSGGTALFQYIASAETVTLHHYFARQGIWLRQFDAPSALRMGLPPADAWDRLEQALAALPAGLLA